MPFGSAETQPDRKSTLLNSSHSSISYAVFCLKKKTGTAPVQRARHREHAVRRDCSRWALCGRTESYVVGNAAPCYARIAKGQAATPTGRRFARGLRDGGQPGQGHVSLRTAHAGCPPRRTFYASWAREYHCGAFPGRARPHRGVMRLLYVQELQRRLCSPSRTH